MPRQGYPAAHPRGAVVPHPELDLPPRRVTPVRFHLHRDLFRVHVHLVVQGILCLRILPAGLLHLGHRHAVHHDRRYLLFAQRGEPQVAVDGVQLRRVRRGIRVPVQRLLLRVQDEDDGFLPDVLLFRVHGDVLPGAGDHHRGDRLLRRERVRAEDL